MNLRQYFAKARNLGFAIGAFNAANLETVKAIIAAGQKLHSPILIESSPSETQYIEPENLDALAENAKKKLKLPIFVNLDHGQSFEAVVKAIEAGYEMVHFDGSALDYKKNLMITKKVVQYAHKKGIIVEGELGFISGSSAPQLTTKVEAMQKLGVMTDPDQAAQFVKATGIDILATFIGNVHGLYQGEKMLDLERLKAIHNKCHCFLSLHGGSGIGKKQIDQVIKNGVVKVNVNTELRQAYKKASQKVFKQSKEVAIYKLMPKVIEAVQKVVEEKIILFNCQNKI